ncbi:hypothetical protein WR164_15240 [Philodulcilactobacillus myokoensis]|uniref:SAP domain-containing protein n=1 Tax=Philodulcilactobacillus myokoensis TaxID=2929573 RepID=A0A9W6B280_9LACO|nr:SAP domain-containing protein [Philodulcilactobacillus myokoensis]GLB47545.1 hypothetical protein WR164_15240 [Philodulcilactobacillus myokoensis]
MTRPQFNQITSPNEFLKFYWYKEELRLICWRLQLPTSGTKANLNHYILQYLNGIPVNQIQPIKSRHLKNDLKAKQTNLNTKLLNSGFALNNQARLFFANYFNVKRFTFKKVKIKSII